MFYLLFLANSILDDIKSYLGDANVGLQTVNQSSSSYLDTDDKLDQSEENNNEVSF